MRVWVVPEKKYRELGERRWMATWQVLRKNCKAADTTQENDDFDYDRDLRNIYTSHPTREAAIQRARRAVDDGDCFFGCASVYEEVVDWFVEEDRVAHWDDSGPETIVDDQQVWVND